MLPAEYFGQSNFSPRSFFSSWLILPSSFPKKKSRERYFFNPRHFVSWPFSQSKQIKMATFRIWLSKMLTSLAHDEKLALRDKNYQTRQIIYSRPTRKNSNQKFAAHLRNKLSKLPREAKSSDVYLKCALAFKKPMCFWDENVYRPHKDGRKAELVSHMHKC